MHRGTYALDHPAEPTTDTYVCFSGYITVRGAVPSRVSDQWLTCCFSVQLTLYLEYLCAVIAAIYFIRKLRRPGDKSRRVAHPSLELQPQCPIHVQASTTRLACAAS